MQEPYQHSEHLFLLPIGGTATAPLAGLLKLAGHRVEGVDSQLYPPMSTLLEDLEIPVRIGFSDAGPPAGVDRVIIGNAVPRTNPEVAAVLERRIPCLSQAEAVAHYLLAPGRDSLVVAGTHGKTTTSAMLAWILEHVGADPSYLVGGMLPWSRSSFRLGQGPAFVIEGDEYNTAFFDRGPKFLHYRPHLFVLGPVEYDHADIYSDLDAVLTAFRAGTAQVPTRGAVVVNAWSEHALHAARGAAAPVVRVGETAACDLQVLDWTSDPDGCRARISWQGESWRLELPASGHHNLQNAALAVAAAVLAGTTVAGALEAIARFPGVLRRMQVVGEAAGVTVVDDFAHHPTALAATIRAARDRWPGRRLVVAFEPRSISAANIRFQEAYREALLGADLVLVAAPFHRDRLGADALDRDALAEALTAAGVPSLMPPAEADLVAELLGRLQPGDVVLGCSSGDFRGFHRRLVEALA